jgi:4-aminobutyrate aminotransferase-like enzyme
MNLLNERQRLFGNNLKLSYYSTSTPPLPSTGDSPSTTPASKGGACEDNNKKKYNGAIHMVRGSGQYLYDDNNRQYLDLYNNVAHIGHSHPTVTEAATKQLSTLNTNTRYLSHVHVTLAKRLTSLLPSSLSVCYFVNSGSEANDLALRLARTATHTRRATEVIVVDGAYHGNTSSLIDISPYKFNGRGGDGAPSWVHTVPTPNVYRGPYDCHDNNAGQKYANDIKHVIDKCTRDGKSICAFFVEAINSGAGQVHCYSSPPPFLSLALS